MMVIKNCLLFSGCLIFLWAASVWAGGPILVDTSLTGQPVLWENGHIVYHPETTDENGEGGSLGSLSNEAARDLVKELFQVWANTSITYEGNALKVASLNVQEGEGLGEVHTGNLNEHFTYCPPTELCLDFEKSFVKGSARTGVSPLIFDRDGALTDMILGEGARLSILGFAGPRVVERSGSHLVIEESQGVINGLFIDCEAGAEDDDPCQFPEVSLDAFKAVILHELGHFLGLDHSQVNFKALSSALSGNVAVGDQVTTMSPLFIGSQQLTLHYDDKVAVASLYPSSDFVANFCTITGTVFESDGVSPLQGVNVIARALGDEKIIATSFVSGSLYTGASGCDEPVGAYHLHGIQPGLEYTLEVEAISLVFQGGSSIEPCDPPQTGFDAFKASGTFSCDAGGQDITVGSGASTDFVTTKGQVTDSPELPVAGGCQLASFQSSEWLPMSMSCTVPFLCFVLCFLLCYGLPKASRVRLLTKESSIL